MAATAAERRCIEAANLDMTDDDLQAGFVHAGFALTALPHRRIDENEWVREAAGLTLRIESGRDEKGIPAAIPYGASTRFAARRSKARSCAVIRSANASCIRIVVAYGAKRR
jgi:hypothetical protein